jgi:hypothetical protein
MNVPELNKAFDEAYAEFNKVREIRNNAIEEVAKEIEKMTAFGQDTIASFAIYIRDMKL